MPVTGRPLPEPSDDDAVQARARTLASPLRLRIIRLCLHESRTNKELADELGVNPGTMLHHVRSLESNGFLVADEPRPGKRGAKEIPYRATGLSWGSARASDTPMLIETFLQEIDGLPAESLRATRLGLKLTPEHRDELLARFRALFQEYVERDSDPDGEPISLFFVAHPDLPRAQRGSAQGRS